MLLVVDAGNTNTVMAIHDGHHWVGRWRISTNAQRTSDEYAVWLLTLLTQAGLKRDQVSAAVIGTVVPAALYDLRRLCRDWFEVEPLVANATLDWGFEIKIPNPDEVGADRLLNTLACHQTYGGPAVVIDFGTATTFDVIDADGGCVFGATIGLEDMSSSETVTYQIVGDDEADIKKGKISISSPIARALIGKRPGDVAEVKAPGGVREYEILDVKYI